MTSARQRGDMSYESTAEPIKIGYLMDFVISEHFPQHFRDDLTNPFDMVFGEALENGVIDRPVEIVYREVEGLPKGSVKKVIDTYAEPARHQGGPRACADAASGLGRAGNPDFVRQVETPSLGRRRVSRRPPAG